MESLCELIHPKAKNWFDQKGFIL